MKQGGAVSQEVLDDIIRRIVGIARPDKIILFGSAVRGEMGPHSDVDLLVIKSGDYHPGRLTEAIYQNLHGAGAAVDVIVVTPEEVERYRDAFSLVIYPALREGKVVYAAWSASHPTTRGSGSIAPAATWRKRRRGSSFHTFIIWPACSRCLRLMKRCQTQLCRRSAFRGSPWRDAIPGSAGR